MSWSKEELENRILPVDETKPYIFVSYSSLDYERVYETVIQLQRKGVNVWIDTKLQEHAGEIWHEPALRAINRMHCKGVLFFVSKNSMVSASVCAELVFSAGDERHTGARKHVKFIPVVVDDTLQDDFENWYINLSQEYGATRLSDRDKKIIKNVYDITSIGGEKLKTPEYSFNMFFEEVWRVIDEIVRICFVGRPDDVIRVSSVANMDRIVRNIPDSAIQKAKAEEIEIRDAQEPERGIEEHLKDIRKEGEKVERRRQISNMPSWEKQIIVNMYQEQNPDVFEFEVTRDDGIRISKYYDDPERSSVQIPDFVCGVRYNKKKRSPPFAKTKYLKEILPGKGITDMSYFFAGTTFEEIDVSNWDVGHVTNFRGVFYVCKARTIKGLESWSVGCGMDFSMMFAFCEAENIGDLSHWNVSHGTDFSFMFSSCKINNIGDLSRWDVSHGTDFSCMFISCNINNIGDLSYWDVSHGTDFSNMFGSCQMEKIGNLSQWDISSGMNFSYMFAGNMFEYNTFTQDIQIDNWKIDKSAITTDMTKGLIIEFE